MCFKSHQQKMTFYKSMYAQNSAKNVLLRDCKTRRSRFLILERFYLLRGMIKKAIIDIKIAEESLDLNNEQMQILFELIIAPKSIKTTIKALF